MADHSHYGQRPGSQVTVRGVTASAAGRMLGSARERESDRLVYDRYRLTAEESVTAGRASGLRRL